MEKPLHPEYMDVSETYEFPDYALCFTSLIFISSGPGSSVGIATDYGLDGPGIESR